MHLCGRVFAVAMFAFATPTVAGPSGVDRISDHARDYKQYRPTAKALHFEETVSFAHSPPTGSDSSADRMILVSNEAKRQNADLDMIVSMSGRCSILKIAGRDFACRAVRYFHDQEGRAYFTVAVDDPTDNGNIISFSGESARREEGSLYELMIDRMLLNSKDRPKVDGLRVPLVELSTGTCKQFGDFATRQISSISCVAIDKNDRRYELRFESDGSPIVVQKISTEPLVSARRRAKHRELLDCRRKAYDAKILPRDATAYIISCLEENNQKPTTEEEHQ